MVKPTLLDLHCETVQPGWVDYNGHMNVAYYLLVFDNATDALLEHIGLDKTHRESTKNSVFVVEAHLTYEKEVMNGDKLRVSTQVLDADEKRIHIFHRMHLVGGDDLIATNELMILSVDLTTRRASPLAKTVMANLREIARTHGSFPRPNQAGRIIGIHKGKRR